jgi:hypothetical protein
MSSAAAARVTIFIADPGIISLKAFSEYRSSVESARLTSTLQNERSNCGVSKIEERSAWSC